MGKTVESVKQQIANLTSGKSLLVQAVKTTNPSKIQLEFAEKTQGMEGNANALLSMLNASDERFTSGARRAWVTAEIADASKMFGINFGDDADWVMDPNLNKEVLPLGIENPTLNGFELRVQIEETLEGTEWQLQNIETSAKRRGKDGDYITHNGKYIFSNTRVVPLKKGVEPKHVLLQADAATATVDSVDDIIIDETSGM
jgi:hypothetical protein